MTNIYLGENPNSYLATGGVKEAVQMAKEYAPFVRKIEIEVENLDMLREALEAGADIIMLDNMSVEDMREAVKLCAGKAETECSGKSTELMAVTGGYHYHTIRAESESVLDQIEKALSEKGFLAPGE